MTQPFVGKVEFQTAVDHKTRLTVDPDSPTSALLISNQDGSSVISIGDPNGNVALPNDLSATRIFVAGRPDLGGLIRVSDRNGREVISTSKVLPPRWPPRHKKGSRCCMRVTCVTS